MTKTQVIKCDGPDCTNSLTGIRIAPWINVEISFLERLTYDSPYIHAKKSLDFCGHRCLRNYAAKQCTEMEI